MTDPSTSDASGLLDKSRPADKADRAKSFAAPVLGVRPHGPPVARLTKRQPVDKRRIAAQRAGGSDPDPDIARDRAWAIPNATRPLETEEAYATLVEAASLFELVDLRPPEPLREQGARRILRRIRAAIERILLRARMSLPPSEGEARHALDEIAATVTALPGGPRTRHHGRPSSIVRVLAALRAASGPLTGPALAAASLTKIVTMRNCVSALRRKLGVEIVILTGGPRALSTYRLASHEADEDGDAHDEPGQPIGLADARKLTRKT